MATRDTYTSASPGAIGGDAYMNNVAAHIGRLYDAIQLKPTSITNSGNDYTLTVDPVLTADVADGMGFFILPNANNSGAARMRVGSGTYYNLLKINGAALASGEFNTTQYYYVVFLNGGFFILSQINVSSVVSVAQVQTFTASGTWTKPSGLSDSAIVIVELWGAGGGGGGAAGGRPAPRVRPRRRRPDPPPRTALLGRRRPRRHRARLSRRPPRAVQRDQPRRGHVRRHRLAAGPLSPESSALIRSAAARSASDDVDEVTEYFLIGTFTSLLVALASELRMRFGVERVYLAGHSAGGFMTNRVWCEANGAFDAYLALSGPPAVRYATGCSPSAAKPYLAIIGSADDAVIAGAPWDAAVWSLFGATGSSARQLVGEFETLRLRAIDATRRAPAVVIRLDLCVMTCVPPPVPDGVYAPDAPPAALVVLPEQYEWWASYVRPLSVVRAVFVQDQAALAYAWADLQCPAGRGELPQSRGCMPASASPRLAAAYRIVAQGYTPLQTAA